MSEENEDMNTEESRIERVKKHFRENRRNYVAGATGVVIGAVGVIVAMLVQKGRQKNVIEQTNVGCAVNNAHNMNILFQRVSRYGNKIGHPGNAVMDLNTGERWEAQYLAARDLGVSDARLSKHLNGKKPHINGRTLVKATSKQQIRNELEEQFNELLDEKFNSQIDWDPYD